MKSYFTILFLFLLGQGIGQSESNLKKLSHLLSKDEVFWQNYFAKNHKGLEGIYFVQQFDDIEGVLHESGYKCILVKIEKRYFVLTESKSKNQKLDVKSKIIKVFQEDTVLDRNFNYYGDSFEESNGILIYKTIPVLIIDSYNRQTRCNIDDERVCVLEGSKIIFGPTLVGTNLRKRIYKQIYPFGDINEVEKIENIDEWKGNGTGFFLSPNGLIATNYHVVKGANKINIKLTRINAEFSCEVKRVDKINDLAILKCNIPKEIDIGEIPYVLDSEPVRIGAYAFTLGFPLALSLMGEDIKFTDGKISSLSGVNEDITNYQISIPIQGGNSGGPLFNEKGDIIGVTSSKLVHEEIENVGYAIKITYLNTLYDMLESKENNQTNKLNGMSLEEKINVLKDHVVLIKVK